MALCTSNLPAQACACGTTPTSQRGTTSTLPKCHGFVVGDFFNYKQEDGGVLDPNIKTAIPVVDDVSGPFVIKSIDKTNNTFTYATKATPGTLISNAGTGGKGAYVGGVVSGAFTAVSTLPTTNGTYGTSTTATATSTNGTGKGLTVDVTIASNNVASAASIAVNAGGTGYKVGDEITIKGSDLGGTASSPDNDIILKVGTASAITGGGDSDLPAHINMSLADFMVVCQVRSVSLDLSREELDTTALSCTTSSTDTSCDAPFRTTQSGYTSGTGTMEVMFTSDQSSLANRLLASSLRKDQSGAEVKLYLDTVQGTSGVDDTQSMFISGPITLLGFSLNVTPGEVTTATVNFTFSGQPTIDLTST